ncbi:hypothetical protein [Marivirga sp.]|uniref:hypothetical protein n=1 Tax=Marivirga sp. TaxID=2018662 RepID=UPI003DA6F7AB
MPRLLVYFYFLTSIFISQNSYSQLISYDTHIRIEDGRKITEKSFLIQINDKSYSDLAHVEIPHSKSQQFEIIEANILDKNGDMVRKLKNKEIKTRSYRGIGTFYQDNLITEFDLYWNIYPYKISYKYSSVVSEFLFIANWTPIYFTDIPTLKSSLVVELPKGTFYNLENKSNVTPNNYFRGEYEFLEWELGYEELQKSQIFSPPIGELIARIMIVPHNFQYGIKGKTNSWSDFGDWQHRLNKGTDQLPDSEKLIIDDLIRGIDKTELVLKKLYEYLQDKNTYINVAIDIGGLKSYPASYVCKNRYGDCKALTTYMKAMLNYVGIDSYYTLINSGDNIEKINKSIPSQQFDHVILAVPLEKDTVWLENTANFLPYNYLGTFTQNRYGLLVKAGGNSQLVKTPSLMVSNTYELDNYSYSLKDNGEWSMNLEKEMLRGESFEYYLYELKDGDQRSFEELLLKKISPKGFLMDNYNVEFEDRGDHFLKITATGNIDSPISEYGKLKVIQPLEISMPKLEDTEDRTLPLRINYPINKSVEKSYEINVNDNQKVTLPSDFELKSKIGNYQVSYSMTGNIIETKEVFQLHSENYLLEDYATVFNFIEEIIQYQSKSAIIIK